MTAAGRILTAWRLLSLLSLAAAGLFLAMAQPVRAFCFCPECLTGTYDSYQPIAGSMKPAIEPGACVIVTTRAAVERGDIIVFFHPLQSGTAYVKRLIGLPGDIVELRGGRVILNGAELPQVAALPYLQRLEQEGPERVWPLCPGQATEGSTCEIARWTETLPSGASWDVLDTISGGPGDDFGPVTVPEGMAFVLGDHRDNSADSRFSQEAGGIGFVPANNIIGPVVEIENP
jgi:signal peptidase I